MARVLFVGCGAYTRNYGRYFAGREYVTLDVDPAVRRHGAERHICDSLANAGAHFAAGSLDLIVCNGVFGWGLNRKQDVESAFIACHAVLRPGGVLVLGWNDIARRRPFRLYECESLGRFAPYVFAPLGVSTYRTRTRNRHTFDFFAKPV